MVGVSCVIGVREKDPQTDVHHMFVERPSQHLKRSLCIFFAVACRCGVGDSTRRLWI